MSITQEHIEFALELFDELGGLTTRKMMGVLCIYQDGLIFSIIHSDGTLWLKGKGDFAEWMAAEGWEKWSYQRDNGIVTFMPYWRLSEDALDDPELACNLARKAISALS